MVHTITSKKFNAQLFYGNVKPYSNTLHPGNEIVYPWRLIMYVYIL